MKTAAAVAFLTFATVTVASAVTPTDVLRTAEMISRKVNSEMTYESDRDQYGVSDRWVVDPVSGRGDCEDNAFTKVKQLEQANVPARVVVCLNKGEQAHAVTLINDGKREWVLDSAAPKTPRGSITPQQRLRVMYAIRKDAYTCDRWIEATAYGKEVHVGQ